MKKFFLLSLVTALTACHQAVVEPASSTDFSQTSAIIGGNVVSDGDPIQKVTVKLSIQTNRGTGACTGVIVSPNTVLTAAHCQEDVRSTTIRFHDGSTAKGTGSVIHPDRNPFSRINRWDFAIVHFNKATPVEAVAEIATEQTEPQNGAPAFIAGFGRTNTTDSSLNNLQLKNLAVQISNLRYSSSEVEIDEGQDSGACHGDSGGPGYILQGEKVILWGVDSAQSPQSDRDCYAFELYSRVSSARDWILQNSK